MWRFLRLVLAFLVAFIIAVILGTLLLTLSFTGAVVALSQKQKPIIALPDSSWLYIPLTGELREYQRDNLEAPSFSVLSLVFSEPKASVPTLEELRRALEAAAENKKIRGIVLYAGALEANPAQIQQIGRWLRDFQKKSQKPIHIYGEYYTEKTYYLAALADSVFMYPGAGGGIEWNGVTAEGIFFRKAFQRWGIRPILVRVGKYKSAAESFTEEQFSEANREQLRLLLEDVWTTWIDSVSAWRGVPAESLRTWPDTRIFLSSKEAKDAGLVDALLSWEDWQKAFTGEYSAKNKRLIPVSRLLREVEEKKEKAPKVAILYAEGAIGPTEDLQAEDMVPEIERLRQDTTVKAVILRVNSPGGAVLDSDRMATALKALKAEKPLIVSMGGVAASGGYYISAYADSIFAERTTITGSIGVIGVLFNIRELMEKHLDLRSDRVRVGGRYADFLSPYREPDAAEIARLQGSIDEVYQEFLQVVKAGRRFPSVEAVHSIAQGRVWSGADALEVGLVDGLGGLERALEAARQKAGLDKYTIITAPKKKNFVESWLSKWNESLAWLTKLGSKPSLPTQVLQMRLPEVWID
jgi:protease IV